MAAISQYGRHGNFVCVRYCCAVQVGLTLEPFNLIGQSVNQSRLSAHLNGTKLYYNY